ncbi:hypothetical protein A2870_01480 [Candidatus Curtissbacteria bacterium RIFCSPHIGHO2_01_FULL_41_11]|uniref:Thioredoxin domain-containing protein n=1 Tax=Candidatus Curtissbacteria bacterium RIFCSPHIGHO2_01_FULL_41_11 TaxID=1797711 RepID=A0A1F5G6D8_9BACT|nr:MAG: hypothetical protein A2870_01480 [Candidatus Curtissbacteria bacterium RIFCSPHIGHO2_01_FULL_41_11]
MLLGRGGSGKSPDVQSANVNLVAGAVHTLGEASASATIVEFGDYQCPACKQADPIVKKFLEDKGSNVYFIYRHFPLTQAHANAMSAARAAEAAGIGGKFWGMHHLLYEKQAEWSSLSNVDAKLVEYASSLGLNIDQFKNDMGDATGDINSDKNLGEKLGVQSTPTFFVNGKMYPGVLSYEKLVELTK